MSNCDVVTFTWVSWVRWGDWLYWFLIFAFFLTLKFMLKIKVSDRLKFIHRQANTLAEVLTDCTYPGRAVIIIIIYTSFHENNEFWSYLIVNCGCLRGYISPSNSILFSFIPFSDVGSEGCRNFTVISFAGMWSVKLFSSWEIKKSTITLIKSSLFLILLIYHLNQWYRQYVC